MTDALTFPSVTSVLAVLDKPAINNWRVNTVADAALDNLVALQRRLASEEREDVRDWLIKSPYRQKKGGVRSATALGTVVHDLCEQFALGTSPVGMEDDEAYPFFLRFAEWCEREQPEFEVAECTVVGHVDSERHFPIYPYAGTLDGIAKIGPKRVLIDYTTNRDAYDRDGRPTKPYREKVTQMAAYRFADLILPTRARVTTQFRRRWYEILPEDLEAAEPMPTTDAAYIVHLTPQSCRVYPVAADEQEFERFLHLRAVFEEDARPSREVIGAAL